MEVLLCAVLLLQLSFTSQCYQDFRTNGRKNLESPGRLSATELTAADNSNILQSYLVHRDQIRSGTTSATKPSSERLLDAVKRSKSRLAQLERRMQLSDVEAEAVTSMETPVSAASGEYVMQFSLGTPPQKFSTIMDTGSDLCWVQCTPCTTCSEQYDALFDPENSSTFSRVGCTDPLCTGMPEAQCSSANTCNYTYGYGDGSTTSGNLDYETVTLSASVSHIGFGCGRNQQGTFSGVDGLVGLGQGPLSLPSQFSPSIAKVFSYCLVTWDNTEGATSPITFGNSARSPAAKYTPLLSNPAFPTFYYVQVTGISIGRRRLSIPSSAFAIDATGSGGIILDSGTTLTYWSTVALDHILAGFRQQITFTELNGSAQTYGLDLCYDVSSLSNSQRTFPNMVIHFTNVDFTVPYSNNFAYVDTSSNIICLLMSASSSIGILGNMLQQNNLIVYDVVNQRVGFEPVNCGTL